MCAPFPPQSLLALCHCWCLSPGIMGIWLLPTLCPTLPRLVFSEPSVCSTTHSSLLSFLPSYPKPHYIEAPPDLFGAHSGTCGFCVQKLRVGTTQLTAAHSGLFSTWHLSRFVPFNDMKRAWEDDLEGFHVTINSHQQPPSVQQDSCHPESPVWPWSWGALCLSGCTYICPAINGPQVFLSFKTHLL